MLLETATCDSATYSLLKKSQRKEISRNGHKQKEPEETQGPSVSYIQESERRRDLVGIEGISIKC